MRISDWSSDVCSSDLPVIEVAIVSELLVNGVHPGGDGLAEWLTDVGVDIPCAICVRRTAAADEGVGDRALGDAVDYATAAAAPEDHRVCTFPKLDPPCIVEAAILIHVVSPAIDEDVSGSVRTRVV